MKILVITNHNKKMQLCSLLADDAAACNDRDCMLFLYIPWQVWSEVW